MNERRRELTLLVCLVGLLGAGLAYDGITTDASIPEPRAPRTDLYERAVVCPPLSEEEGVTSEMAVAGALRNPVTVGVDPLERKPLELGGSQMFMEETAGRGPIEVIGFKSPVRAGVVEDATTQIGDVGQVRGAGGSTCALEASTEWYFPVGSSLVGARETIVVANPFPGEAVVEVTFLTEEGSEASAKFADVAVPAGKSVRIDASSAALPADSLAVQLTAARGRVTAWKALALKTDESPSGFGFSLGVSRPRMRWYFPFGQVGEGVDNRIAIVNPHDDEAIVSLLVMTSKEVVRGPRLMEIAVPGQTSKSVSLAEELPGDQANLGDVSVALQSENDVTVAAEKVVAIESGDREGVASEVGAADPARAWVAPPAVADSVTDQLAIMNPFDRAARVDVSIVTGRNELLTPDWMQGIKVPGGLRVTVPLRSAMDGKPHVVRVTASKNIVVERIARSSSAGDIASVLGQPAWD